MSEKHVAELMRARKDIKSGDERWVCNALRRPNNLKLTFDVETGKLKSAEVLK